MVIIKEMKFISNNFGIFYRIIKMKELVPDSKIKYFLVGFVVEFIMPLCFRLLTGKNKMERVAVG